MLQSWLQRIWLLQENDLLNVKLKKYQSIFLKITRTVLQIFVKNFKIASQLQTHKSTAVQVKKKINFFLSKSQ